MIHGGSNEDQSFSDFYEFNIRQERWRSVPSPTPASLEGHTLTLAHVGISYALLSIGGASALASQALRLDILVPSANAAHWKVLTHSSQTPLFFVQLEELIVPAPALSPFLDYIKDSWGMLAEVRELRDSQRQSQEERRSKRALVEKLSAENQDLRLQLQEVTEKLELALREPSQRYSERAEDYYITFEARLRDKQREIDMLTSELKLLESKEGIAGSEFEETFEDVAETLKQLRDNAMTIITSLGCSMPAETALKVVSMTSKLIIQNCDKLAERINTTEKPRNIPRDIRHLNVSSDENKITDRRASQSSRHRLPRQEDSHWEQRSGALGVDIGLQAGKGKIKLTRKRDKKSLSIELTANS